MCWSLEINLNVLAGCQIEYTDWQTNVNYSIKHHQRKYVLNDQKGCYGSKAHPSLFINSKVGVREDMIFYWTNLTQPAYDPMYMITLLVFSIDLMMNFATFFLKNINSNLEIGAHVFKAFV